MKKFLLILMCCCLAVVTQATAEKTKLAKPRNISDVTRVDKHAADKQIKQLKQEIMAAKANGEDTSALLKQLRELRGLSGTRSDRTRGLDDGGETCDDATVIGSLPYTDEGTTDGYANDLPQQCGSDFSPEVFYRFTPSSDMTISMNTCGNDDFDNVLEIWEDCPGDGATYIDCNDDYCDYQACIPGIEVSEGSTYYIIVCGFDAESIGDYTLNVYEGENCPSVCEFETVMGGNGCADAVWLSVPAEIAGSNETDEDNLLYPDCGELEVFQPQWYAVTGDGSEFTAQTCDCDIFDNVIVVYCGDCCNYSCVAYGDQECGDQASVTWCTVAGAQYFVVVGGYQYDYGDYSLTIDSREEPCEAEACERGLDCFCSEEAPNTYCARSECDPINDYETTETVISVPDQLHITDVNVCLTISHTYIGDLSIWLESPQGTEVVLYDRTCDEQNNFPCITFDDEAEDEISEYCDIIEENDSYFPWDDLSSFDGENAQGLWRLYVSDGFGEDEGGVLGVCLTFEYDYILSAELISFSATPGDASVELNWQTASETNNDRFDILRGDVKVAEVNATNNASGGIYSWTDANVTNGTTYDYSLVSVDLTGATAEIGTVNATPNFNSAVITEYALHQNYPNPFNPSTTIAFDLVEAGLVNISLYNMLGQEVAEIVNGNFATGRHTVEFDGKGLSSGVYFYRLQTGEFTTQKKLLLMK